MNDRWHIDLNCDLGEGGSNDAQLLGRITSANIACGVHAGSPDLMRKTVGLAIAQGVGLGAHPGLGDVAGMGRREVPIAPQEAFDLVARQVEALQMIAVAQGRRLDHVKPHGALYNISAKNPGVATAIARAVFAADKNLILFGLAGTLSIQAARDASLSVAEEAFVDRGYQSDGSLTPRAQSGAVLDDPELAARRAVRLVKEQRLTAGDGRDINIRADTLCVHGDNPAAWAVLARLHEVFHEEGITIERITHP